MKKIFFPASIGVAAVWFGTHVGPGSASGNQTASYFGGYGKLGLIGGFLSMLILGLCIFYCIEYSRLIGTTNFKEFANSFFHPYEKFFSSIFEFSFIWMVLLNFSSSLATGSTAIQNQFNLSYWIGISFFSIITIVLAIFGANLVRKASTIMTLLIFIALIALLSFGLLSTESNFMAHWQNTISLPSTLPNKPWYKLVWSSIIYSSFLTVGMMGTTLAVSDSLKSRDDSKKATIFGIFFNTCLIFFIAILLYAYPLVTGEYFNTSRVTKTFIPNLEIVNIIGKPFLIYFYIIILILAIISTLVGYGFGVISRYGKYIPIKNEKYKNLILLLSLIIIGIFISRLGLDWIISKGFRFIGYIQLIFIVIPTLLIGHKKISKAKSKTINTII